MQKGLRLLNEPKPDLPMVNISTLLYLVDDFNEHSDIAIFNVQKLLQLEKQISKILDRVEIDPGEDLVYRTLERVKY